MRKSVVLLITLAIIVAISALVYSGLSIVDKAFSEVEKKHSLIQTDIFFKSLIDVLKKRSKEINSSEGLEVLIYMPIELISDEIEARVEFDSAAKGINPNNFLKVENKKEQINPDYVLLFDRILQRADVLNKELFIAMIEDSLDKDFDERVPGSEIALYDRRFRQGSIENFKKFDMLIKHYILLTEDGNINKIPWKSILSFYSKEIDINYISPILVEYILPYEDLELIKKVFINKTSIYKDVNDLPLPKEDKEELKKFDVSGYVPIIEGNLTIKQGKNVSFARFVYDIKNKKVLEVEEL